MILLSVMTWQPIVLGITEQGDDAFSSVITKSNFPLSSQPLTQISNTNESNNTISSHETFAQTMKFSTKGGTNNTSSLSPNTTMWTIINGTNTTLVYHDLGNLIVARLTTHQNSFCNYAKSQICLDGKIITIRNSDNLFSIGGQVRINIYPDRHQETIESATGQLKNQVLQVSLTKIWSHDIQVQQNVIYQTKHVTMDGIVKHLISECAPPPVRSNTCIFYDLYALQTIDGKTYSLSNDTLYSKLEDNQVMMTGFLTTPSKIISPIISGDLEVTDYSMLNDHNSTSR